MLYAEYIGFTAAVLTTTSFLPQAYKVWRTRKTGDLSLGMFLLFTLGVGLWLVYGLLHQSLPIITANFVTFLLALYILLMKLRHG